MQKNIGHQQRTQRFLQFLKKNANKVFKIYIYSGVIFSAVYIYIYNVFALTLVVAWVEISHHFIFTTGAAVVRATIVVVGGAGGQSHQSKSFNFISHCV